MSPHFHDKDLPKCPICGRELPASDAQCIYCSGAGMKNLKRLLSLLRPYRSKVLLLMLTNTAGVLIALAPPYLTKHIVDDIIAPADPGALSSEKKLLILGVIVLSMIFITLARVVVKYLGGTMAAVIGAGIVYDLRSRLHDTLQRLELKFLSKRNSGEYTGRIMHDTEAVQRFLIDGSTELVVEGLTMFGIAGVLLWMDWKLALIVFSPAPFLIFFSNRFHKKIHALFHKQGTGIAKLNTHISETMSGIRTIKAFANENRRLAVFNNSASDLASTRVLLEKRFFAFFGVTETIMEIATICVWFVAGWMVVGGSDLTLGEITAFMTYIAMFYGPIRWLTHVVNSMVNAMVSAERIFLILDAPREDEENGKEMDMSSLKGEIAIENAHFSYKEGHEVLSGVSLHIKSGEMVGLVGRSGVGKSTLINLICRFYRLDSGDIKIDGVSLSDVNLASYRRKIGMVLQEPFLFDAPIFDNIACAKPSASEEEVIAAAKAAHAHDFIMKSENGYATMVGEGGAHLSGGEKQRIAIARAILHDPPILILDEATSSVDTEAEQAIRKALARLCKGRTVIAIAHRLSTLRNADRLAVMDGGKVAELGSHDELLAKNGIYARLVRAQTELNEIHREFSV